MAQKKEAVEFLKEFGLSELEANIYTVLLSRANSTGYKIAQKIGKPVANTYKALELLQKKGLVVLDLSQKIKLYSALPISEYMDQLEAEFIAKRKKAEASLTSLDTPPIEEGLFRLQSADALYERAKQIIRQAKEVVLAQYGQ